jgi:2-keto-4-pentenoate hydratase
MPTSSSPAELLAGALYQAYESNSEVELPPALEPQDALAAYAVQKRFLGLGGLATGGWKIGAKSESGPIQGAPLPRQRIYPGLAQIDRRDYPVLGIELEIFFTFSRDFLPQAQPVPEKEVMDSVSAFGVSIEIVSSRIAGWPDTPKLTQLADLQNHGALVIGQSVRYRSDFPFSAPHVDLRIDGEPLVGGVGRNPAGDPRRLLCWLVNHCRVQGLALAAGSIITTGSYTGMEFPTRTGRISGEIEGLPAVSLELS